MLSPDSLNYDVIGRGGIATHGLNSQSGPNSSIATQSNELISQGIAPPETNKALNQQIIPQFTT
jgi:hypothetical protein